MPEKHSRRVEISYDLIGEDVAMEGTIRALLKCLAEDIAREVAPDALVVLEPRITLCRNGSRVKQSLRDWQQRTKREGFADLTIVAKDANCRGAQEARNDVSDLLPKSRPPYLHLAIPDPHVEHWLLLDALALQQVFGATEPVPKAKCDRDFYKQIFARLSARLERAAQEDAQTLAPKLIGQMDLGKVTAHVDKSLSSFLTDLRASLKQLIPPKA